MNTLTHRAKTVWNNPELLQKEIKHLRKALTHCKYPKWALNRVEKGLPSQPVRLIMWLTVRALQAPNPTTNKVKTKGHIVIPYTQDLCKGIKRICRRYGIQTNFKGNSTIKNLLVSPKDKDPMANKNGAIYWFQCGHLTCDDEYIGETSRIFGERFKEHLKEPSPVHNHSISTDHPTPLDNFQIIGREDPVIARTIKESIYIRVNNPILNRNIGKCNLHHIWVRVFLNTTGLQFKGECTSNWVCSIHQT